MKIKDMKPGVYYNQCQDNIFRIISRKECISIDRNTFKLNWDDFSFTIESPPLGDVHKNVFLENTDHAIYLGEL